MNLTKDAVRIAFETRLLTFQGGGDINVESSTLYQPAAGRPYISGQLLSYTRTPMGVGTPTPAEVNGVYTIRINRPTAEGSAMADKLAARLVVLFDRGTALVLGTGQVLTIHECGEMPTVYAAEWLSVPVTVAFFGAE